MNKMPTRLFMNMKDVMLILGVSRATAWRLLKKIRIFKNKQKHQSVNVLDFSEYTGIPLDTVRQYLI